MQFAKLGIAGAVLIAGALGLLWLTDILPQEQLGTVATWAFGGLLIILIAALALHLMRGNTQQRDQTDRPIP